MLVRRCFPVMHLFTERNRHMNWMSSPLKFLFWRWRYIALPPKSQFRGVFQWRISQITQRNCSMNALTSKLGFGEAELRDLTTPPPPPPHKLHIFLKKWNSNQHVRRKQKWATLLLPVRELRNSKPGEVFPLFMCTLGNSYDTCISQLQ